jgi:hypothetical protein
LLIRKFVIRNFIPVPFEMQQFWDCSMGYISFDEKEEEDEEDDDEEMEDEEDTDEEEEDEDDDIGEEVM